MTRGDILCFFSVENIMRDFLTLTLLAFVIALPRTVLADDKKKTTTPSENVTFTYGKVEQQYQSQPRDGGTGIATGRRMHGSIKVKAAAGQGGRGKCTPPNKECPGVPSYCAIICIGATANPAMNGGLLEGGGGGLPTNNPSATGTPGGGSATGRGTSLR